MTYPMVKQLSPWGKGCIKDAEVWNRPPGAACAGDRDSSAPVPSQAGWGQPCLEGLSLKFFLLLRRRAHFGLPCEGFWAEHGSPSPWREGVWLWPGSSAWFTGPSCSWLASAKHPRRHPKPPAPNPQAIYLPSQKHQLIAQISPPLQSPPSPGCVWSWQLVWAVSELQRWRHLQTRATGYFEQFLLCLRRPPDPLTLKDWNCHTRAWCANDWCAG